ncbi:MAG: FAD-dependent oxidoreductase [Devosia sp.]
MNPDFCVIGAGASGIATAEAAARLGASVVMVERGTTGGQSLRSGALAMGALAAAARTAAGFRSGAAFGIVPEEPKVNFRRLREHIAEVLTQAAPDSGPAKLGAVGIELIKANAVFADPRTLAAGETLIKAHRFVIATGARPQLPDLPGLFSVPYFTTETIFDNTRKLTHLVVIGAGPMGLELALSYRRLGCEVTLVEPGRLLPDADPELAEIALRTLREEGINLLGQSSVLTVHARSQGIGVVVRTGEGNINLDVSHILVAPQRVANLNELQLDGARIKRSQPGGLLQVNGSLRTSNPRVFAVGEAVSPGVAHDVMVEGTIVARAALLSLPGRYDPATPARLTLTDPPIAEIGLTEPMARERFKTAFEIVRASYGANEQSRAARMGAGVVKVIVAPSGQILGAGIVGPCAGELMAPFALALTKKLTLAGLAGLAVPFPSHGELLRNLGDLAARSAGPTPLETRLLALNRLLP